MAPGLEALRRLLPPPPVAVTAPPWDESANQVGFSFPADYRRFVAEYGYGTISTPRISPDLEIVGPHSWRDQRAERSGFKGFVERHVRKYAEFLEAEESSGLHDIHIGSFPSLGGLLSWGENGNSDMFFWSTSALNSDEWPIVIFERHPGIFLTYDGGIVDFLVDLLEGRHHASGMMSGGPARWVMNSDWTQRGLSVTAGPAAGLA
jgi:hypothetical protein